MEYWITYNDMNIWKVIQNGNNMKKTRRDRDGRIIILPPTTVEEHIAVQRESNARTTLLQFIPDDHVALTLKTKGRLELLSFDDLYYKLKTLEVDVKGYTTFSLSQSGPSHSAFVSATSASKKMSYGDSPSYSSSTTYSAPSNSKTGSHRSGNVIEDVLQSFVADTEPEQQLAYEDFEQIEKLDLEEMDLKWQMAMLSVRLYKFEPKARRKIDFDKKESARFNKKKARCYKCQQRGHFARECRAKGGNDKQRYSSFKIKEIGKKEEESKALITVDTLVDWTDHDGESDRVIASNEFGMIAGCDTEDAIKEGAAKIYNLITGADTKEASTVGDAREFALMGVTSEVHNCPFGCDNKYNELNEQNGEYFIQVQAYKNSLKTLEKQKIVLQRNQLTLEDKIRVLSIELENTSNLLKHFEKINVDVETAKKDLQTKLDNHLVQTEKFAKADSMKAVPSPLSGDYTSLSDHIDLDESQMSYGTKSSTSCDSKYVSNDFVSCDDSDKSLEVNTNDFASSDSSVKSSKPKQNDSTSCASTSSVSTSVNEAEIESNVGTPIQEPIIVQDLPSFSCNSFDKNEHISRTSCNKNGYFNKRQDCDFYEKQMANKTVGIGVGPVHSRNKVNHQNQFVPQAVLLRTGKVNIPLTRPQPVPTGKSFLAAKDKGIFDSGCSRSMTGNKERLDDFQEFQGRKVTFGGGEDTECLVRSKDFKLPDETSRPDIMFAISACSRNQVTPTTSNLEAVKKIFKYLKGQPKLGLWYLKESPLVLKDYSDSDYAGANKDRKSTTGRLSTLHSDHQPAQNLNPNSTSSMATLKYKDEHNKVGYLFKPIGSDDYHQIIDFLRASHIRSPELGPPAIQATIDKTPYTITEDLVRSRLQLADDGGSTQAPPAGQPSGGAEDPITLTVLSSIVSTLVQKVNSLETKLKDHKKLFKDVVGKLVKKVKTMEIKIKTKKRKMVVSDSDQEKGGKQDVDLDALRALANAAVTVDSNISHGGASNNPSAGTSVHTAVPTGATAVPAGASTIPLGASTIPPSTLIVPAGSPSIPVDVSPSVAPAGVSNKRKSLMVEEDIPIKARTFKQMEENRLANASLSKTLLGDDVPEENFPARMAALIKRKRQALAEKLAQERQNRPMTQAQQRTYMRQYVKNQSSAVYTTGWTMAYVKSFTDDQLKEEFEKICKTFIKVVSTEDSDDEAPLVWSSLVGWEVLFDSHKGGKGSCVWKHQDLWEIKSWRLYTLSNVHVLETVFGEVLSVFADVSYPLSIKLMEKMLTHKLEID
nr:retrovirus-related Pol polyprotein from transposon TNT 1-94 [Tanacetum cinerariifolium]